MGLRQPPVPRGYNKPFRGAKVQRLSQNAYLTREQKVSTGCEFWIFNYRSNLLQIMQPRNFTSVHQANLQKLMWLNTWNLRKNKIFGISADYYISFTTFGRHVLHTIFKVAK